jgi:membrane protease YdiL (CAAX protease family)
VLLGRRFCPACYAKVATMAGPAAGTGPNAQAGESAVGGSTARPTRTTQRPLPGWASAVLYLAGFALVVGLGQVVLLAPLLIAKIVVAGGDPQAALPGFVLGPGQLPVPWWILGFAVYGWGSLALVVGYTAWMGRVLEKQSAPGALWAVGLRNPRWTDLGAGLLLPLFVFVWFVGIGSGLGWVRPVLPAPPGEAALTVGFGFLLLLPLAALEEIGTRGFLLNAAARSWGKLGGVAFSTLAFVVLHGMNTGFDRPLAWVGLALAGLYLASAVLITENLWLAIFLHAGWNLAEGPIFGFLVSGTEIPFSVWQTQVQGPEHWTGGSFGPEASLLLCLLLVLHTGALWALRSWLRPSRIEEPAGNPAGDPIASERSSGAGLV